jgi:hypothetical protein
MTLEFNVFINYFFRESRGEVSKKTSCVGKMPGALKGEGED